MTNKKKTARAGLNFDPLSSLLDGAIVAVVCVAVGACLAVLVYILAFADAKFSPDPAAWGQFGDFFGGLINPAVGIVTVFLVLLSIAIQRRELKQSNEALKLQNSAIALQSFEQSFFSWLNNYRDLVSSVTDRDCFGRDALLSMKGSFLARHPIMDRLTSVLTSEEYEDAVQSAYVPEAKRAAVRSALVGEWQTLYNQNAHHIDSIFRTLYRLVRWVDEQPSERLTDEQKWHFVCIIRAQLSTVEMVLLFYNGFTDRGLKFAPYINKYAMFDNLEIDIDLGLRIMHPMSASPFSEQAFNSDSARGRMDQQNADAK